jgi:diguanylate cyclase (GGDEF)-like protein
MGAETSVTLDAWILAGLLVAAIGLGVVGVHAVASIKCRLDEARERKRAEHTLAAMFRNDDLHKEIEDVSEQPDRRRALQPTDTLVRGRIDHMREVQQLWGQDARRGALEQVAAIMKRSVRGGGEGDVVNEVEGDSFTILMRGAEEKDAGLIAKRLRRELSHARIDGLADNIRLSASFGVAERRTGESFVQWRKRAESALRTASERGEDQIVEASVVEEARMLPPPSPKAQPSAA